MWEREYSGSDGPIPGNGPIPSILDQFGGFNRSKRDFEFSKLFDLGVIVRCGELSAEDSVEVDCSTSNNVLPL